MRKLFFVAVLTAFSISAVKAQIITKQVPVKKNTTIKTTPPAPPPPPPAPAQQPVAKQGQPGYTPAYTLTSARVNIRTGIDNKEFLSDVSVSLWKKDRQGWNYSNDCYYKTPSLKNEMAVNSNTDLGLDKYAGNADKLNLTNLQTSGLDLIVTYQPNIFLDAWKIENITLILEFKDQNGNLHPTLGSKIISFSTAVGFLNAEYRVIKCKTDQNFNPLTASIEK